MRTVFHCIVLSSVAIVTAMSGVAFAQSSGRYTQVGSDILVNTQTTLLTTTISFSQPTTIFVSSDGRYYPNTNGSAGYVYVTVDGGQVGNSSIIDWRGSNTPAQHSFNVTGSTTVSANVTHTIRLVGGFIAGSYSVGAQSNLSVFGAAATRVVSTTLGNDLARCTNITTGTMLATTCASDTGCPTGYRCEFNFYTGASGAYDDGMADYTSPNLPHFPVVSQTFNPANQDIVVLASGRSYKTTVNGDVMWGIYSNGQYEGFDLAKGGTKSQWTVNDHFEGAEFQAPMYAHAFFPSPGAVARTISLDATEFPSGSGPNENFVRYRIGAGATLTALSGGMTIKGSAPVRDQADICGIDYIPIGPSVWCPMFGCTCPPLGTDVTIAQATFTVPPTHNGNVMISAKARVQGGELPATEDGNVYLWITVDGVAKGSLGVQRLKSSAPGFGAISQRTLTASYLALGLFKTTHTIAVHARADGTLQDVNVLREVPLVYFD